MKKLIHLFTVLLLSSQHLIGQSGGDPISNIKQDITRLYRIWDQALVRGDAEAQDALLADEFVGTTREGNMFSKKQAREGLESKDDTFAASVTDGFKFTVVGDTAVVTCQWNGAGKSKGVEWKGRHQETDTWIKHNGKWLVLASHVTMIDSPAVSENGKEPGQEMKKLSVFVGNWHLDETDAASPFGPAGTGSFATEIRYIYNGAFIEERGTGAMGNEPIKYTILYYYDASARAYRSFYYDSNGVALRGEGMFNDNRWQFSSTQEVQGKAYKVEGEAVYTPDGKNFSYEWKYSEDGSTWKPMFKGTARKVKS